jgi:hypothetical protein
MTIEPSRGEGTAGEHHAAVITLRLRDRSVASYVWRHDLPRRTAPRPYLHPVTTLAGTVLTELMPMTHPHHLGLSLAVPDVSGHNFWGSRTYLPGHGPAWLDNHGCQHHVAWDHRDDHELRERLRWTTRDDSPLLDERRRIAWTEFDDRSWMLDFASTLVNITPEPVALRSPATLGRPGAGYGGVYWRVAQGAQAEVFAPERSGLREVHGSDAPWMALTGTASNGAAWTMILLRSESRSERWFVRATDHVAVGLSLAWDSEVVVAPGTELDHAVRVVVADGRFDPVTAAGIAADAQVGL